MKRLNQQEWIRHRDGSGRWAPHSGSPMESAMAGYWRGDWSANRRQFPAPGNDCSECGRSATETESTDMRPELKSHKKGSPTMAL